MAKNIGKEVPDLSNATPVMLLDEIARMRVESARLKFLDGVYKQALIARLDTTQLATAERKEAELIKGEAYNGQFCWITQDRIDGDAVKEYFKNDPETLKRMVKTISYAQLNTKPKE